MTGLFSSLTRSHRGPGRQYVSARKAERRQFLDLFADCLSEGGSVATCAARLGKGKAWGEAALREIRAGLGIDQCR